MTKEKTTKPTEKKPAVVRKRRKTNYLNNRDLYAAVVASKEIGEMSPTLAKMLTLLTSRYASKPNFAYYPFNADMQSYAMVNLVKTWASFNTDIGNNPFAYYTQSIKRSFYQFLNSEKRQRNIRDELLIEQGLTPSYTYQIEHSNMGEGHERHKINKEVPNFGKPGKDDE